MTSAFIFMDTFPINYNFDYFGCLRMSNFCLIWKKLSTGVAVAQLEAYFGGAVVSKKKEVDAANSSVRRKRFITVVLLDEIDYMLTKKQTVLYNLFDWPIRGALSGSYAQLIVVGISNTLNLPERLHPRVQSRLGKERCIYSAYKAEESANILKARLGITKANPEVCIQYSMSGLLCSV